MMKIIFITIVVLHLLLCLVLSKILIPYFVDADKLIKDLQLGGDNVSRDCLEYAKNVSAYSITYLLVMIPGIFIDVCTIIGILQ